MPNFRILSLNGGGIKGVYSASFLAKLESLLQLEHPLADYFDLIVGTSTGGLIAIALSLHQKAASIRDFYLEQGSSLFPVGVVKGGCLKAKHFIYPKHDDKVLRDAIKKRLGTETLLGDAKRPLVITSFNAATGKPVCFKTRHHPQLLNDHTKPAWEVAMATAAAPTFYRAFESSDGTEYIDGGVWANCPILVGILEATQRFKIDAARIEVLNVGTTRSPFHVSFKARRSGAWRNVSVIHRNVVDMLAEASMDSCMNMAKCLIGADRIHAIDTEVAAGRFAMDDAHPDSIRDLRALGEEKAKEQAQSVGTRFLSEPATAWSPCA